MYKRWVWSLWRRDWVGFLTREGGVKGGGGCDYVIVIGEISRAVSDGF